MLNPSDVANKRFDKSMGRYKPEDVDAYLAQLAGDIEDLVADKRELEQKLMVLAEKLEEYKHDEESLRAALIGAQKLGDSVVRDAKAKAQSIMDEANSTATQMVENARRAIEREQTNFVRIQREVATFKSRLQLMYKQHLELISSIPVDENLMEAAMGKRPAPAPEPEVVPPPVAEEIPVSEPEPIPMQAEEDDYDDQEAPDLTYEDEGTVLTFEPRNDEYYPEAFEDDDMSEPDPQDARRESRFGPLKFGKDFDIKRDSTKRKK